MESRKLGPTQGHAAVATCRPFPGRGVTLLAKGCQEILAYVLDNKKKVPVLEEIPVVKDFFDVFLRK